MVKALIISCVICRKFEGFCIALNHRLICWPTGFRMTPNFHIDIAGPVYFREFNEVAR